MEVETIGPGTGHYLDEVVVTFLILGQQYEVVIGCVQLLALTLLFAAWCHIDLTAYDRLKVPVLFLQFLIYLVAVVLELLYAHHVAMISHGNAPHTIGYGLVYHLLDVSLAVQQRVLRMDMEMYEFLHFTFNPKKFLKLVPFRKRDNHAHPKVFNK